MKRLEQLLAALTPKRWPVRWGLAAVSAGLTFLILIIFAMVVGWLTSNRLQSNFNDELHDQAEGIAFQLPLTGERNLVSPSAEAMSATGTVLRVVTDHGHVSTQYENAPTQG